MMNDLNKQTDAPAGPSVPEELQFTENFEWVRLGGRMARIGLTDLGQARFVQIKKVELPKIGARVKCGDAVGTVHCATGANPVTTPLSGTITEVNERLVTEPGLVNSDPYGEGWIFSLSVEAGEEVEHLLDPESYRARLLAIAPSI